MVEDIKDDLNQKEALKRLRESRKENIARVAEQVKKQRQEIKAIKAILREGTQTVPELARKTDLPPSRIFWYLAALKKYGAVVEGKKVGSYFHYGLVPDTEEVGEKEQ